MSAQQHYDVAVIGSGPAGSTAALLAAQRSASVVLIEGGSLGGVSLHNGCIPVKSLVVSSRMYQQTRRSESYGIFVEKVTARLATWVHRQRAVVAKMAEDLDRNLEHHGVNKLRGHARFESASRLRVQRGDGDVMVSADKIFIATGARPAPFPGAETGGPIGTSDDYMQLTTPPEELLVIGGGYIGCELASIFHAIGSRVRIVTEHGHLLAQMDPEAGDFLKRKLESQGVDVLTGVRVTGLRTEGDTAVVTLGNGEERRHKHVLVAVGRIPNTEGLGLDRLDMPEGGGAIPVNDHLQTSVAHIYAVGDVNGRAPLAHSASAQAHVAVSHAFGDDVSMDFAGIPFCVYTNPEMTAVGLTETQAREAGYEVVVGRCPFRSVGRAVAMGELEGFIKLIADASNHRILGGLIVGPEASELIAQITIALKLRATAEQLSETIFAHPTLSEALPEAARRIFGQQLAWP